MIRPLDAPRTAQLKILQEGIALTVPFADFYLKEKLTLNYLYATLFMGGVEFFTFRDKLAAA